MTKKDLKLRILQLHRELHKDAKPGTVYIVEYSGREHIKRMERKEQAKRTKKEVKNELRKLRKSLQKFTVQPTPCPKCGKREILRTYRDNIYSSAVSEYTFLNMEYLLCYCVDCGYEWKQEVKC